MLRQDLTPDSLAKLLATPEKLEMLELLLEEEARLHEDTGDAGKARASRHLATAMRALRG